MESMARATANAVLSKISNLPDANLGAEYSYHSLPICIIDAVFSIGVRYGAVKNVVQAWCVAQEPAWPKHEEKGKPRHTVEDFLKITEEFSGEELSERFFGNNRQRTSSRGGILKADATVLFAKALKSAEVNDFSDMLLPAKVAAARSAVGNVTGHASGISFDYFQMLAGDDSFVKADRMICRFVANANNLPMVTPEKAREAVSGACALLIDRYPNLTPRLLDHLIWKYQSGFKETGDIKA